MLVDNGGGGIFDFLPVATQADAYEEHVATPTGLDFARAAAACSGCSTGRRRRSPSCARRSTTAIGAPRATLVHVRTDRAANVALHRAVWEAVAGG